MFGKYKIIIILIIVLLLAGGASFYFLVLNKSNNVKKKSVSQVVNENQQEAKVLKAEDIGLSLSLMSDKKAVVMKITRLSGISSVEYEMDYMAEAVEEGEKTKVPRGVVNSPIEVKSSDKEINREILLGTCSKNVCKYDNVVSDIKFIIRVNYKNGEIGSVEEKLPI